jgi:hypothetical protein
VQQVKVVAGDGSSIVWEEDAARIPPLKIDLFPDVEAYGYVEVCIQEKSGIILLKKFKTDCKPKLAMPLNGEEEELKGFWAPVRMLRDAMVDESEGSSIQLQFRITEAVKKKEETIDVPLAVTSSDLIRLLGLLKDGFPAPPPFPKGD